ncbi:hypothetical protein C8F01DRAFT_1119122 [Mycena amicta]|nr:hypothetical protein C8F01DRAFT_1119122 [Mycena amicta]
MESAASSKSGWNKSKACLNCRKRKIRCDLVEPQCGPCSRSMKFQDCEYVESGPSTTQMLEEQIAGVEARIRGLRPAAYGAGSPPDMLAHEISPTVLKRLISDFFRCAAHFGFFLDSPLSPATTTPALTSAIQLWAIHLSRSEPTSNSRISEHEYEASYLSRALRATADALSPLPPSSRPQSPSPYSSALVSGPQNHSGTVLQTIQSHVLLANYFFRNVRILEGKYHLGAAVGLVLGAGMHRRLLARSAEQVNAFWTVYTMDCCWTTADGSPSNFPQDIQALVDVPWPRDGTSSPRGWGTITAFLNSHSTAGTSPQALHAKAAILFERASQIAVAYRPHMPPEELNRFFLEFTNVDTVIQQFRRTLPQQPRDHTQLLAHVLTCVAAIQLHNVFVGEADSSRQRVLEAARDVVAVIGAVRQLKLSDVDPILGTLLMATCHVFLSAIAFSRNARRSNSGEELALRAATEHVLDVMSFFAPRCKLMDSQLKTMRDSYHRTLQP